MVEKLKDNTFRISNFYFLSTWKYDTGETENINVFAISWSIFLKQETKGKWSVTFVIIKENGK